MRYLMSVPVLETPYLPVQDFRQDWLHYSATWIEWSLTITGVSLFILLFMLASKLAPIIPVSEMAEDDRDDEPVDSFTNNGDTAEIKEPNEALLEI